MLKIHIDSREVWDETKEEFINIPGCDLNLEHSLLSVSKWEAKYHKSFSDTKDKTREEVLDYIRMMCVDDIEIDVLSLYLLTQDQLKKIQDYIDDPMTATIISNEDEEKITDKKKKSHKFTTSEEIYSWMCAQNIPFECEKWHLNRLIILIKLCAINNMPEDKKKKKMTSSDLALRRAKMEAARAKFAAKK